MTDSPVADAGSSTQLIPPPLHVQPDEPTVAELGRIRYPKKRSFFKLRPSRQNTDNSDEDDEVHESSPTQPVWDRPKLSTESEDMPFIQVGSSAVYSHELTEDYSKDVYRWAVIYENQRGVTLFSTRYYSRLSLLPIDPPAFTLPSTSKIERGKSPALSLSTYPLPDGSWRWVSRMWMVDMRGDGHTQCDGFEYNWVFRTKHWRAQTGFMSAGGWVRRRRWVRLMVRPALVHEPTGDAVSEAPTAILQGLVPPVETGATRPPSVIITIEDDEEEESTSSNGNVWQGSVEQDWQRCRRALMRLERDGRKLELWSRWLKDLLPPETSDAGILPMPPIIKRQWTEDEQALPSQHMRESTSAVDDILIQDTQTNLAPAMREHVAHILRIHGSDILGLFVYPDSRTHFIELIALAGLLPELTDGLEQLGTSSVSVLDFWSSSQSLQNLLASDFKF